MNNIQTWIISLYSLFYFKQVPFYWIKISMHVLGDHLRCVCMRIYVICKVFMHFKDWLVFYGLTNLALKTLTSNQGVICIVNFVIISSRSVCVILLLFYSRENSDKNINSILMVNLWLILVDFKFDNKQKLANHKKLIRMFFCRSCCLIITQLA